MKNKLIIGIIALAMFALSAGMVAAKANFSGVWTLDGSKSEGLPPGMTQTMNVTQNGDRLEVEITLKAEQGEARTVKDAFVLDGKETDFTPPLVGGTDTTVKKAKRTSKWTKDEKGFESTEEAVLTAPDGGENTIKAKRQWSLSSDGKTLTIEVSMQNPNGDSKSKRVFVKK